MRADKIIEGQHYRLKSSPNYGFFKACKVLKARTYDNRLPYAIVEGEHTTDKDDRFGILRTFKATDIVGSKND